MYKTQIAQITTSGQTVILSLNINTDGVPVFSSSNYSIHPVLCTINNFPPVLRKKYFLLVSLWFESKNPIMNEFLKPILSEPQKLAEFGFIYSSSSGQVTCKVVTSAVVCDSVARPTLQNMNQFNGKFGWSFCLHKGDMIPKGNGMVRVYPHIDTIQTRTHGQWSRDASEAQRTKLVVNGINDNSILFSLMYFNMVVNFVPDYMHNILLGVVRQFFTLWFDSAYHEKPWYIVSAIDRKFLNVKPPHTISRTPR